MSAVTVTTYDPRTGSYHRGSIELLINRVLSDGKVITGYNIDRKELIGDGRRAVEEVLKASTFNLEGKMLAAKIGLSDELFQSYKLIANLVQKLLRRIEEND